jgi:hypothetical protein
MKLRLRTSLPMEELAAEVTALLWADLSRLGGCANLEEHRYPGLLNDLKEVLRQHIGSCTTIAGPDQDDLAAHTGGGPLTRAQRLPVCSEHAQRLTTFAGAPLQELLNALKKTTVDFLSQHEPPFDNPLTPVVVEHIHHAVERSVKSHLIQNLASPCCDNCEQARTTAPRRVVI